MKINLMISVCVAAGVSYTVGREGQVIGIKR